MLRRILSFGESLEEVDLEYWYWISRSSFLIHFIDFTLVIPPSISYTDVEMRVHVFIHASVILFRGRYVTQEEYSQLA